ncbi:cathepsin L, putative [Perkinsus marinus ATCC 50983]|uniref:Cathepsin L, putative n=1 Tax=Perkinsus marinus (strain ATCC 50983 / TXsc) TaxID=423536 RepID=C5K8B2_PERM5|nr:cathepsin L, putative [Perkinsus marinus ATCC 50983]XP_002787505.1 cathepsin L, putative [Perkinsus marinus ATCC 50983]EER19300.1 cathepsin L, putative [Perkinsus marinus ATCC 50983]EER19301.1 cathepsin L, putative [Perkinsus marinus ATCC 50983]|eukprot:XP_002787504.1 cathepsin L, putative [Perkinsus marinus ATCC 50983]
MSSILTVLLAFLPLYESLDVDTAGLAFLGFQKKYGKSYESGEEEIKRAAIFQDNLDYIQKVNAQNLSYKLAVNEFADLTFEEFAAVRLSSIETHGEMERDGFVDESGTDPTLPSSVDWRDKNVLTPVKDQGNCGSCWAFAVTGALEAKHAIATGELLSFSEQQLVDCSRSYGNHGCQGGLPRFAYNYIRDHGIDQESTYPYNIWSESCNQSLEKRADGLPVGEVTGYKYLPQTDKALMGALVAAPVSLGMVAESSLQFYHSGVYSSPMCHGQLNHGVVAVGYGADEGQE